MDTYISKSRVTTSDKGKRERDWERCTVGFTYICNILFQNNLKQIWQNIKINKAK